MCTNWQYTIVYALKNIFNVDYYTEIYISTNKTNIDLTNSEEYNEKVVLLDDILEFVHRIDKVGFLQQEDFDRVQEIAKLYYEKENGEKDK